MKNVAPNPIDLTWSREDAATYFEVGGNFAKHVALPNVNGSPRPGCVVRAGLDRRLGVAMAPNLRTMARRRMNDGDVPE